LIKEKLIPYAVDYFTGKIYEYDDSSDEDYDDNGDSEEEGEQSKPECKQQ
jgi:nucleosome assembly protein 1-like 1